MPFRDISFDYKSGRVLKALLRYMESLFPSFENRKMSVNYTIVAVEWNVMSEREEDLPTSQSDVLITICIVSQIEINAKRRWLWHRFKPSQKTVEEMLLLPYSLSLQFKDDKTWGVIYVMVFIILSHGCMRFCCLQLYFSAFLCLMVNCKCRQSFP